MKNTWIICRKELRSYFVSPVAYVLLAAFAAMFGLFFWLNLRQVLLFEIESQMRGQSFPMNVNEFLIRPLLSNLNVLGLFFVPWITMRLFAEEKRTGTIELLATSPVRDVEVIVGKWLAAVGLYAFMLLLVSLNFIFLFIYGKPDWKPLALGLLGLLLQAAGLLAIGTLISTMTRNQIIAAAATIAVCLILWIIEWASSFEATPSSRVLAYISVVTHFEPFAKGVFNTKDVIFYLSLIFLGLFLTTRAMESLRWRS